MDCAVITTYRCNARCKMCDIWQHPTKREKEFRNIYDSLIQSD